MVLVALFGPHALAVYTSPNYQTNEFTFGAGGDTSQSSPNYQGSASVGLLGVGTTSSPNFQAYSGFLTPNEPFLSMIVNSTSADLGVLSTTATKTANATFQVTAYLDSGYRVYTMSDPPKTRTGAMLTGMPSTAISAVGTDQFGINVTGPNNVGAGNFGSPPSPQPNGTFAFGEAAAGYGTVNQFKYVKGDYIADTTTTGWGQTNYTISYIANISALATAGAYSVTHDLVAVPTY